MEEIVNINGSKEYFDERVKEYNDKAKEYLLLDDKEKAKGFRLLREKINSEYKYLNSTEINKKVNINRFAKNYNNGFISTLAFYSKGKNSRSDENLRKIKDYAMLWLAESKVIGDKLKSAKN